jgi:uncharacterized membrane protein YccC
MKLHLLRLSMAALMVAAFIPLLHAKHDYERARQLVSQTDNDLRAVAQRDAISGKEKDRYDAALKRLSDLDQDLARGKFDEHKLNEVIEHIDDVLKDNAVSPGARDALREDLRALRELKKDWD